MSTATATATAAATAATVATAPNGIRIPRVPKLRSSCDNCNRLKIRCGQEKPSCARCRVHGIACVYGIARRMGKPKASRAANQAPPPLPPPPLPHTPPFGRQDSQQSPLGQSSPAMPSSGAQDPEMVQSRHQQGGLASPPAAGIPNPLLSFCSASSVDSTSQQDRWDYWSDNLNISLPRTVSEDFVDDSAQLMSSSVMGRSSSTLPSSTSPISRQVDGDTDMSGLNGFLADFIVGEGELGSAPSGDLASNLLGNSDISLDVSYLPPVSVCPAPEGPSTGRAHSNSDFPHLNTLVQPRRGPCIHYLTLLQRLTALEQLNHTASSNQRDGVPSSEGEGSLSGPRQDSKTVNALEPPQLPHLPCDILLSLTNETLGYCSRVLGCNDCLTDVSCLLIFAIVIEKSVGLYQVIVRSYGIWSDALANRERLLQSAAQGGQACSDAAKDGRIRECSESPIRVGDYKLGGRESRMMVKMLVKLGLREMAGLLDRLRDVVSRLPSGKGQASTCKVALENAWGELSMVNGVVDLWL